MMFASSLGANTTSKSPPSLALPSCMTDTTSSYMRRMKQLSAQKKAAAEADEE